MLAHTLPSTKQCSRSTTSTETQKGSSTKLLPPCGSITDCSECVPETARDYQRPFPIKQELFTHPPLSDRPSVGIVFLQIEAGKLKNLVDCRSRLVSRRQKDYGPNDNPTPLAANLFLFLRICFFPRPRATWDKNRSAEGEGRSEGVGESAGDGLRGEYSPVNYMTNEIQDNTS